MVEPCPAVTTCGLKFIKDDQFITFHFLRIALILFILSYLQLNTYNRIYIGLMSFLQLLFNLKCIIIVVTLFRKKSKIFQLHI